MSTRNRNIDIVKGIGIISVVIGHAFYIASKENNWAYCIKNFVYVYHLCVFFWTSGVLYRSKSMKEYFRKLLKNYIKYVSIAIASYLLLPIWYYFDVIEVKSLHEIIYQIAHILLFQVTRGIFTGPMWFVTWLVVSQTIYFFVDRLLQDCSTFLKWMFFSILGLCGMFMSYKKILVHFYYLDRAFLVQPILFAAYICRKKQISMRLSLVLCPMTAIVILIANRFTGLHVELSHSELYGFWLFYPIILVGILFCLSLSNIIQKFRFSNVIEFLGKNSFIIMAAHIMGFKLLDGIIGKVIDNISSNVLHGYPTSFSSITMCCLYTLVGILFPLLILKIYNVFTVVIVKKYKLSKFYRGDFR